MKLSVVIPVYNEEKTVEKLVKAVQAVDVSLDMEIVLVDDRSADGSREILQKLDDANADWPDRKLFVHQGRWQKGADPNEPGSVASSMMVTFDDAMVSPSFPARNDAFR